ncbi:hypothetical protein MJO52_11250 [Microbulbifer variabilis]|uniref:Uncharacterized protein n=1 Tax=Microbulbifer variabilis TaxID=266805 RepID=A0ABY4V5V4_9GAMM|nr:hypothetical protein [Microbulbifer variabilis]USD19660.1 hypothetical protein MJO52_11250 [Microbulbifer variabilis]
MSSDVYLAYQAQLKSIDTVGAIIFANYINLEGVYNNKKQTTDKAKESLRHLIHDFGVETVEAHSDGIWLSNENSAMA